MPRLAFALMWLLSVVALIAGSSHAPASYSQPMLLAAAVLVGITIGWLIVFAIALRSFLRARNEHMRQHAERMKGLVDDQMLRRWMETGEVGHIHPDGQPPRFRGPIQ